MPHYQDLGPDQPRDHIDDRDHSPEVRRELGRLKTPEAETLVVPLKLAPAREMDDAPLTGEEGLDNRTADALALTSWNDGDRGELAAPVPVSLDLADPNDRPTVLGDNEVRPIETHAIDTGLLDEAANRFLISLGRGADGQRQVRRLGSNICLPGGAGGCDWGSGSAR